MPKRSSKPQQQKSTQQSARKVQDTIAPAADPPKKPAPNKANLPRPAKKQDAQDIERADSEGMAQPQDLPIKKKKPAANPDSIAIKSVGKRWGR